MIDPEQIVYYYTKSKRLIKNLKKKANFYSK